MKDFCIYIMDDSLIVYIHEGTGDNLWDEDIKMGYVDYIMYDTWQVDHGINESDGGMVLTTRLVQDMSTDECVDYVLNMMGYEHSPSWIML